MTPEKWKKLDALFHEALEIEKEARAAHLAKACSDDEQLREEAERLLAASARGRTFAPARLVSGRQADPLRHAIDGRN
jgi:hypothetical protein